MTPRRGTAAALLVAALLAAAGCAADAPAPEAPTAPTAGASPSPAEESPARDPDALRHARAVELVSDMDLETEVGSVVMAVAPGADAAARAAYADAHRLGGVILMGDDVPADRADLPPLTAALAGDEALPRLVAADQEGGVVSRLPWDAAPGADALKHDDPAAAEAAFAERGALLAEAGIDVNFGIVADITDDPGEFIFERALGTAPAEGAERVAAAVAGEAAGSAGAVASTLKHFPGHGSAPGDSHTSLPESGLDLETWRERDGRPFAAGVDAGAQLLMYGHLRYPAVAEEPASLSPEWHRIAREELGFAGVAVTDDLGMLQGSGDPAYADPVGTAVAALAAGNDLLLLVAGTDEAALTEVLAGLAEAVEADDVPRERLDEAAVRVAELRLALAEARGG